MKKNKGFTLAELLIVVAIIAVLVAIAIPVFSAKLESSREATDLANIRSAYAKATTDLLTGEYVSGSTDYQVKCVQKEAGWKGDNASASIGGVAVNTALTDLSGKTVTVDVTTSGSAIFTVA